jgi:hypothetical protein
MPFPSEYPIPVKLPVQRSIPPTLALVGLLFLLVSLSSAQHESASASAGSSSSSGHSSSASAPSAMSPAHIGYAPSSSSGFSSSTHHSHSSNGPTGTGPIVNHGHPHHHSSSSGEIYYPYLYAVPFPYTAEATDTSNDADADDDDDEYQGGPTIFDRRGSGASSYVAPTYDGPAHPSAAQDASADPEPPPPPTTLVFKNGNQLEIENYAIVSQTLYDLTPGHPRKIALADLDLPATEKQNDDRGVTFQLPPQAN